MRVLLVPAAGAGPVQVQEIQLNEALLQQVGLGQGNGGEYQEASITDYQDPSTGDQTDDFTDNKYYESYPAIPDDDETDETDEPSPPNISLIPTRLIQKFTFLHKGLQTVLAVDSGAEGDCITEEEASRLGIKVLPLDGGDRVPQQADGNTPLDTVGAAKATFSREGGLGSIPRICGQETLPPNPM